MAAILKIQNGGHYSSQITCLHFLSDSNNKKLSIHKISCFYDNLNIPGVWCPLTALLIWLFQNKLTYYITIHGPRPFAFSSCHDIVCDIYGYCISCATYGYCISSATYGYCICVKYCCPIATTIAIRIYS